MSLRKSLNNARSILFEKVVNQNVMKVLMYLLICIYISLLVIGHIIASIFGPQGYTIWTNWISDLGGIKHTPAPYLYDIACIIAGSLTIPFNFYIEHYFSPNLKNITRMRIRIIESAFIFGLLGSISYIGVGIFSEDRDFYGLHNLTSTLAFGGFTLNAFFMGWFVIFYKTKISKILGLYGVLGPLTSLLLFIIFSTELLEWILLFTILLWLISVTIIIFHEK
ncbi:MAG: DUF998 domain-containing protein [Candidatus Lokiarchaeota archaeon]